MNWVPADARVPDPPRDRSPLRLAHDGIPVDVAAVVVLCGHSDLLWDEVFGRRSLLDGRFLLRGNLLDDPLALPPLLSLEPLHDLFLGLSLRLLFLLELLRPFPLLLLQLLRLLSPHLSQTLQLLPLGIVPHDRAVLVVEVLPEVPGISEVAEGTRARTLLYFLVGSVEVVEDAPQLVVERGTAGTFDVLGRREAVVSLKSITFFNFGYVVTICD